MKKNIFFKCARTNFPKHHMVKMYKKTLINELLDLEKPCQLSGINIPSKTAYKDHLFACNKLHFLSIIHVE